MKPGPLIPATLAVVALVLLTACASAAGKPPAAAPKIAVDEIAAELGAIISVLTYSGTVSPKWTVALTSRTAGPIVELAVQAGQTVQTGDVIAVIDHRTLDDQVNQAQASVRSAEARLRALLAGGRAEDVDAADAGAAGASALVSAAEANLASARERLSAAVAGGRIEIVAQAQAKLDADRALLDKLDNGPTQFDIRNAQLTVDAAKDRLYQNQTFYDAQQARGLASNEQRRAALVVDQLTIDQAKLALERLLAPARPEDITAARALVAADEQGLVLARQPSRPEDIAQLEQAVLAAQAQADASQQQANASRAVASKAAAPFTSQDIDQARAAVDVARAALQVTETIAADATIRAPAAGVISEVPVAVGSQVGPQATIATLLAPELEVSVSVEESQVLLFHEGQPATITVAGGTAFPGLVASISAAADPRTRKFLVKVRPAGPSPARSGMSAVVTIQVAEHENIVLVPKEVVIQRSGQDIVFLDIDGRARMRTVRAGLGDGRSVPILSGIAAGEMVILPSSVDLSDGDAVTRAAR